MTKIEKLLIALAELDDTDFTQVVISIPNPPREDGDWLVNLGMGMGRQGIGGDLEQAIIDATLAVEDHQKKERERKSWSRLKKKKERPAGTKVPTCAACNHARKVRKAVVTYGFTGTDGARTKTSLCQEHARELKQSIPVIVLRNHRK